MDGWREELRAKRYTVAQLTISAHVSTGSDSDRINDSLRIANREFPFEDGSAVPKY